MGQNRPIRRLIEDDAESSLSIRADNHVAHIHVALLHFSQHEAAKDIFATCADDSHPQAKPRRAAGKDGGRGADGERGRVDQFLNLTELGYYIARENQIRVDLASDKDVERSLRHKSVPPVRVLARLPSDPSL